MARRKLNSRGRSVEVNGRSEEKKGYVRFNQWMIQSLAFQNLNPFEVRLLLELYSLFNGRNNGYLFLSYREAAKRCKMGKNTAGNAFHRLTELGFIRRRADEPENYSLREANHWILTEHDFGSRSATKDFMSWRPEENLESRPCSETLCPPSKTKSGENNPHTTQVSRIRDKNKQKKDNAVPDPGHSYNHSLLPGAARRSGSIH